MALYHGNKELMETSPTGYSSEYCSHKTGGVGGSLLYVEKKNINYKSLAFDSYSSFELLSLVINSVSTAVFLLLDREMASWKKLFRNLIVLLCQVIWCQCEYFNTHIDKSNNSESSLVYWNVLILNSM